MIQALDFNSACLCSECKLHRFNLDRPYFDVKVLSKKNCSANDSQGPREKYYAKDLLFK